MKSTDLISLLPEFILLLGAAAVFALDILVKRWRSKPWLPIVALGVLLLALLAMIPSAGKVQVVASMLVVDPFALFFKVLAVVAVALVILLAMPYLRGRTPYSGEFYAFLVIVTLAICLAVSSVNLIMIYLAMEFLSITSYVLAGYLRQDRKSGEAAVKYFLYGATASAVMLYGMSLLFGATGTTDLVGIRNALAAKPANELIWLTAPAIILLLAGFGFKASLVPFHQWAPDTYEGAPTPITAFLSTASKATGFAIMIRVFIVALGLAQMQWIALLVAVAVVTMTLGNLAALRQTNVKRLLAYSSIAQAGYILIGLAAVLADPSRTFTGLNGLLFYLFAYLFTNIGAFAVVIAIEVHTGKVEIKDYAGLARWAPGLAALLTIFLLSLTGIPPTAGFMGKFFVFGAAVQSQMWFLVVIAAVNSVVAAFYYLNIVRYMFFVPAENGGERIKVGVSLQVVLGATALLTLLLGVMPGPLYLWATESTRALLLALR